MDVKNSTDMVPHHVRGISLVLRNVGTLFY